MKIMVIPDTQVMPGSSTEHLRWAGKYAAEKKPDVIVHIGDHWDMASLCIYDKDKLSYEGRTVQADLEAGIEAMEEFMQPIWKEQARQRRAKKRVWSPRLVFCLGNHENRILRAIEDDRKWEGKLSLADLELERMGWEVHGFLEVVDIEDVLFSHYFVSGVMGRPVTSPVALIRKKHMSCVMGHVQDRGVHEEKKGNGVRITGLFAGIFYPEEMDYLNPQTNDSWRGIWMLNEVERGGFDLMPVSLPFLKNRFGRK